MIPPTSPVVPVRRAPPRPPCAPGVPAFWQRQERTIARRIDRWDCETRRDGSHVPVGTTTTGGLPCLSTHLRGRGAPQRTRPTENKSAVTAGAGAPSRAPRPAG